MKRDLLLAYGLLLGEGVFASGALLVYAFDKGRYDLGALGASLLISVVLFSGYCRLQACFLDAWDEPSNDA